MVTAMLIDAGVVHVIITSGDLDFLMDRTKTAANENTEIMLKFYKR